jgi:hypothetical protein
MHLIHSENDLEKLHEIKNKKNILLRCMMHGCHWCKTTQSEWEEACKKTPISTDSAIVDLESNYIDDFNRARNVSVNVSAFPTILLIKGSHVSEPKQGMRDVLKTFTQSGGRKLKTRRRRKTRRK